jgi:hypothetical protein
MRSIGSTMVVAFGLTMASLMASGPALADHDGLNACKGVRAGWNTGDPIVHAGDSVTVYFRGYSGRVVEGPTNSSVTIDGGTTTFNTKENPPENQTCLDGAPIVAGGDCTADTPGQSPHDDRLLALVDGC